jgi:hypothetical protein
LLRPLSSFLLGASLLTASALAQAEPQTRLHVAFHAPTECPSQAAFVADMLSRTARVRLAASDETGPLLTVTLTTTPTSATGTFEVRDTDGKTSTRDVHGEDCAEVARALALIAALTFDPQASTADKPTPPLPVQQPTPPLQPPPILPTAPGPPLPSITPPVTPISTPPDPPRALRFPYYRVALGGGPNLALGALPGLAVAGGAFFEVTRRDAPLFSPSIRLAFEHSLSNSTPAGSGSATFRRNVGVVEGCLLRFATPTFEIAGCAELEIGSLAATTTQIINPKSDASLWLGAGVGARGSLAIVGPLFLDAGLSGVFALTRHDFFIQPNVTIFQPAILGLRTSVGLGLRFP